MKIADNPKAKPAQIERLAKRDLNAALRHPNAPLDLLLEHGSLLDVIEQNPAWPLHRLVSPERTEPWLRHVEISRLRDDLSLLCRTAKTPTARRRLVAWAVECGGKVAPVWRRAYPDDKRPAQARRAALRWCVLATTTSAKAAKVAANAANEAAKAAKVAANAANEAAKAANEAAKAACAAACAAAYDAAYAATAANEAAKAVADEERLAFLERARARLRCYLTGEVAWLEKILGGVP